MCPFIVARKTIIAIHLMLSQPVSELLVGFVFGFLGVRMTRAQKAFADVLATDNIYNKRSITTDRYLPTSGEFDHDFDH